MKIKEKDIKNGLTGEFTNPVITYKNNICTFTFDKNVGKHTHKVALAKSRNDELKIFVNPLRALTYLHTLGFNDIQFIYLDDNQTK